MKNIIPYILVILVSVSLNSCFEYEDVEFKGMQDFKLENKNTEHLLMRLDLKVDNPNAYNITIKPAILDIYVNGKYAGKTKMKEKIVLKKNTTGVYPLYLQANTKDLMNALTGSFGSLLSGKVKVGIKGDVKAKVYGVGKKFYLNEEETISLTGLM